MVVVISETLSPACDRVPSYGHERNGNPPTVQVQAPSPAPVKRSAVDLLPTHHQVLYKFCLGLSTQLVKKVFWATDCGELESLGIHITSLDLTSNDEDYFRPISLSTMSSWLAETQCWDRYGDGCNTDKDDFTVSRFRDGEALGNNADCFLQMSSKRVKPEVSILDDKSDWTFGPLDDLPQTTSNLVRGPPYEIFLLYCPKDETLPHMSAFLSSGWALSNDTLCSNELLRIMDLMWFRFTRPQYRHHKTIPIALVSAAGPYCRLLIAHLALVDGCCRLVVRKSDILDFSKSGHLRSEDFARLLCWTIAVPGGVTT